MIKFLKKLFGIQTSVPKSKYDDFSVEYYPETGVYYAKYESGYLKRHWSTGIFDVIYDIWRGIPRGQQFNTEQDAWNAIDLFIEQRLKENVKIIKR